MEELKVGDLVKLKSDGPVMTVGRKEVSGEFADLIRCQWFVNNILQTGYFERESLEPVEPNDGLPVGVHNQ